MKTDHVTMVVWMPREYWERAFSLETQITSELKEEALKIMNKYNLLAVLDAKRGGPEKLDYTPRDMVVQNTKITAPNGHTYSPLSDDRLTWELKTCFPHSSPS
jgi:hypothetical protein